MVKPSHHSFLLRAALLLAVAMLLAAAPAPPPVAPALVDKIDAKDIEVTLVPEKNSIMLGEPIYVSVIIKNNAAEDTKLIVFDDLSFTLDEPPTVKITAVDKAGVAVPGIPELHRAGGLMRSFGRMQSPQPLAAGSTRTLRFYLSRRFMFNHPGAYTLTATANFTFYQNSDPRVVAIPFTVTAPLDVVPADKEKMGALIDSLEKLADSVPAVIHNNVMPPGYEEARDARAKLTSIADERVIPYYRRKMREEELVGAMGALAKFNNDDALDALKDGLEVTEIVNPASHRPDTNAVTQLHMQACDLLARSPHPGAIPYLLTQTKNPDLQVRIKVMDVIATKLPPKEAIPLLEKMQDDPEKWVGKIAAQYLKTLKEGKSVPMQDEEDSVDSLK